MAHILLIEDEPELREMMHRILVRSGHRVSAVEHGRAAIPLFTRDRFDLIITDLLMPEMDGVEVIQAVRRLLPQARILAISGGGSTSPEVLLSIARKLGADGVLAKPFSPFKLFDTITEILGTGEAACCDSSSAR